MIYFVGAGPGDKELVTVKGQRLLAEADCIIYAGSLVNPALLEYAQPDCEVFDSAVLTLEQVIELMRGFEGRGLTTVRLHTGDPSIYGAIREQIDILAGLGIDYSVVPGVSAFSGAAAVLGAEYTLPGVSQTVILTRMEGRTEVPVAEGIEALASHQASMALFLSAGMLDELSERLLAGGYAPATPAALVYKATWPDQKVVRTTVEGLAKAGAEHGISRTAMVLVGSFLGDEYERSQLYDPSFSHGYRQASEG
jgi:precorrin-4/cobalt-precorrin-4 C11-methyltransferase